MHLHPTFRLPQFSWKWQHQMLQRNPAMLLQRAWQVTLDLLSGCQALALETSHFYSKACDTWRL
jgi:hypothetical protein